MKKYLCEFLGTSILVLFGCGTAAIAGNFVGALGIAFAFGLAFLCAAVIIGNKTGCHINPAVSIAFLINKKISLKDCLCYIISQILGAILAIFILTFIITSANIGNIENVGLGANGFNELSSVNLSLAGALLVEIVLSFIFILAVLKISENKKFENIQGILIGFILTLVHIIGIPLTGTSVNPARSLAPALFLGGEALKQVWVFIIAPIIGSILAALINKYLFNEKK